MVVIHWLGEHPELGLAFTVLTVVLFSMWDYSRLAESREPGRRLVRALARANDRVLKEVLGLRLGGRASARLQRSVGSRLSMRIVPPAAVATGAVSLVLIAIRFIWGH